MTPRFLLRYDTVNFADLMANGKLYRVPPFQRDYSWKEEQWEDLWEDLMDAYHNEASHHYMGAVVLVPQSNTEWLILDGQQRFATLSILVLAAIDVLGDYAAREDLAAERAANLFRADHLRRKFIGDRDTQSLTYSSKLFLNRTDDGFYQDYVAQLREPASRQRLPHSAKLLLEARDYFVARIRETREFAAHGEPLSALLDRTAGLQLVFTRIEVDDQLNAFTVFETLNARGAALTTTDLLKNHLFSLATNDLDRKRMHRSWDWIAESVGVESFPDLLRAHLSLEVPRIRRQRLFHLLRERIPAAEDAFRLMDELEREAEMLLALDDPAHELWRNDPDVRNWVREFAVAGEPRMRGLLLATYRKLNRRDFSRTLKLTIIFAFRFRVIGDMNPNQLEDACNRAARQVMTGAISGPRELFEALRDVYVPDEKFRADFSARRVSTVGRGRRLARYILYKLENDACGGGRDFDADAGTIEHVLPENPPDPWLEYFHPSGQVDLYVQRLGNLALIEDGLNREAGVAAYEVKRAIYAGSAYCTARSVNAPEWNGAVITARQEQMADRAVHIWRSDFA